jgi:hypothetical protein
MDAVVGAHVGPFLRGKNLFRTDAQPSFGYRNYLGNLRLESGLSVRDVFGGRFLARWEALGDAWAKTDAAGYEVPRLLDALLATSDDYTDEGQRRNEENAAVGDLPLNIAAEVQLIY